MFRAGRRVHGRWQCPRCSTCLARGEGPSVVRRVNLEDATWQEVVGVVVGQDVLRGDLRRCIGAISDSERHAASMTRRCHSGKSPTEPASSTRSVRTRSGVSVRCRGFALAGPDRPWRGWLGGAVSGGGGGARGTRRYSTMRSPPRTRSPSSQSACFGEQTATRPGSSAYTSRTALLTNRRAVRSTNHLVTKRAVGVPAAPGDAEPGPGRFVPAGVAPQPRRTRHVVDLVEGGAANRVGGQPSSVLHPYHAAPVPDRPASMGWELHAIATFAGHRSTDSTLQYIHLSGRDLFGEAELLHGADPRVAYRHAHRARSQRTGHPSVIAVASAWPAGTETVADCLGIFLGTVAGIAELCCSTAKPRPWPRWVRSGCDAIGRWASHDERHDAGMRWPG